MNRKTKTGKTKPPSPTGATVLQRPTSRGWRRPGGGRADYLHAIPEWRATTVQACGLWPFAAGSGAPLVGVPIGQHLEHGRSVCCDPISWFQRAQLISNPSEFVLGLPGLGKSSLVRRQCVGLAGYGVIPMVFGDTRPDYSVMTRQLGGQVITLGRGHGSLNVLDLSLAQQAAHRLTGEARQTLLADAASRRSTMVAALLTILRGGAGIDERTEAITERALGVLDTHHDGAPVLADLLQVIRDAPDDVRAVAIDRGDTGRYQQITEPLEASLVALISGGRLGGVFSQPTTEQPRTDRPVSYDLSQLERGQDDLQAAALLACWSAGFGAIDVAQALADAGLAPQRHYFVVLDELWRVIRAGRGMVDRADALTRLNRKEGVGTAYITHTMSDLDLPDPADTAKARGFVERAGMVICGGLPAAEMTKLRQVLAVSKKEEDTVTSWTDPPAWDSVAGKETAPPGRGRFLVKVGGRPGIPLQVKLTAAEAELNDTNIKWRTQSRIGTDRIGTDA